MSPLIIVVAAARKIGSQTLVLEIYLLPFFNAAAENFKVGQRICSFINFLTVEVE